MYAGRELRANPHDSGQDRLKAQGQIQDVKGINRSLADFGYSRIFQSPASFQIHTAFIDGTVLSKPSASSIVAQLTVIYPCRVDASIA